MIGKTLGHYEILELLGKGGMGEVYRARDTKLDRDVAIKVLPEDFATDHDRLARFEREAKLLASLNHANIAAIYGLEDEGDQRFIVMEVVEGETLAERISRSGRIEVDEALEIARQIAEALEAAHENGVVHRDLKPANVIVTPDGKAKVLDFGLAKAYEADGSSSDVSTDLSHSPTMMEATRTGVIMGTAGYMSPEQAKGKPLDKRTDIWSFGALLYEMLTGKSAFEGEDVSETIATILRDEPDWSFLPGEVPRAAELLVRRCLKKDPRQRLRDIGDARNEIEDIRAQPQPELVGHVVEKRSPAALPWVLATLMAATSLLLFVGQQDSPQPNAPVRRLAIDLPWHGVANWTDFTVALSPQGTHFVYNGRVDNEVGLYLRSLDGLDATSLADAREARAFFFSPDGERVGSLQRREFQTISIRGGRPRDFKGFEGALLNGASWGEDGYILLATTAGLYRVPESGGDPERVTGGDDESDEPAYLSPSHLPGGATALASRISATGPQIMVVNLATGVVDPLPISGTDAAYSRTGHLVYRQQSTVFAVQFDIDALRVVGDPIPLVEGVREGPHLSENGTLLYVPERGASNARLVWVDRTGRPTPIPGARQNYSHLDLAGDGQSALLNFDGGDVYVLDIARGSRRLLSSDAGFPIWTVDDARATYTAAGGLAWVRADGSSPDEHIWDTGDREFGNTRVPTSWNTATGHLAFSDDDIWVLPPEGVPEPFVQTEFNERSGRFSPDGTLMAYVSDETGEYQVYVVPFPGPGPKVAVSIDGGLSPIWSQNGRELFFRRGGKVLSASLTHEPSLRVERPVELFDGPYTLDLMGHQRYDVAPDGQQFLMVENSDDFRAVIVFNWFEELKRLAPTGR